MIAIENIATNPNSLNIPIIANDIATKIIISIIIEVIFNDSNILNDKKLSDESFFFRKD